MLFHEKLDIKLIKLVRDNPVLYDHNNVKYMDFNAREVAWQKIGDELKRPAADCKVRWINIRDVYRRILKKNLAPSRKKYKYENEICFLRPFYKDISIQNDELESDEVHIDQGDDDYPNEVFSESDSADVPIKKLKIKKEFSKAGKKKKKKKKKIIQESFDDVVDPVSSTPTFNESATLKELDCTDPIDAFLLSIGTTLKTFSPYHLNLAKSKIFAVAQEYDLQQIVQNEHNNDVSAHDLKVSTSNTMYMQ